MIWSSNAGDTITIPLTVLATAAVSITMLPEILALVGNKRWFWWPGGKGKKPSHDVRTPNKALILGIFAVTLIITLVSLYAYVTYKTRQVGLMPLFRWSIKETITF